MSSGYLRALAELYIFNGLAYVQLLCMSSGYLRQVGIMLVNVRSFRFDLASLASNSDGTMTGFPKLTM